MRRRQEKSYQASDVRFKVSPDEISRNRLAAVRVALDEVRAFLPGVRVSFSLFGSLSKGKELKPRSLLKLRRGNVEKTDIDIFCFFDADDILREHASLLENNPEYARMFGPPRMTPQERDAEWNIFVTAREIVRNLVLVRLRDRLGAKTDVHFFIAPTRLEGEFSLMNFVRLYDRVRGKNAREAVARFFHLDVGGGLKRYRQHFLAQLAALPPGERDRLWGLVSECMVLVERPQGIPRKAHKQFPSTYDEAVAYYGLPEDVSEEVA